MSIDILIHAGTKLALEQWLDARDLGNLVQDVDPLSPTFGQWFYTHTDPGSQFYYWNHPSGVVTKSIDNTDPDNPVAVQYAGFYALLKIADTIPANLKDWVENNTAVSVLDGVSGVGGEGVTLIDPEDLRQQIVANGAPLWDGLMGVGNQWSDPQLWAFSNIMTDDVRDFDGTTYRSLIDFNVWSPTQYPQGWEEVGPSTPDPLVWAAGVSYSVNDEVTYQGVTYRCIQAHTSIVTWEPPNVPALWQVV